MKTSRDIDVLQEEFFRFQLQRSGEILEAQKETNLLLLELGKSLIDIQALVHPAALLNTLAHIKDKAAEEEERQRKSQNGTAQKRTRKRRNNKS